MAEWIASVALLACVGVSYRPRWGADAAVSIAAMTVVVIATPLTWHDAWSHVQRIGPVVGFLAAVLVLANECGAEGLFTSAGERLASRLPASTTGLLAGVAGLAAVTTATLSLDTTAVLVTPVVVSMARSKRAPIEAPAYLTGHLINSASLLLPVSNLTNLLAVSLVALPTGRFVAHMALPWLAVIVVEVVVVQTMVGAADRLPSDLPAIGHRLPKMALAVTMLTVAAFTTCSSIGLQPAWAAAAGSLLLLGFRLAVGRGSVRRSVLASAPSFCLWVLATAVVVQGLSVAGLGHQVTHVLPHGSGFVDLLGVAGVAAVLANVVTNLPATLLVVPLVASAGLGPVLAVLIGVNIGPNLTYPASLATLLWRRTLARERVPVPRLAVFTRLGVVSVPLTIIAAVGFLWLSLQLT